MSARTCQLCGRPLSRIWVGAGGDFCSREHRNQYGLRLGMDRLQEANKVATLMRRRENLKTVMPGQAESLASLERRGFHQSMRLSEPPPPTDHMRPIQPLLDAEVRGGGNFFAPRAVNQRAKQAPRSAAYLQRAAEVAEPMLPALREHEMPVTLPRQRPARAWDGARSLKARRRGFPLPRRRAARAVLSRKTRREPVGGATYQRDAKPAKWLALPMHTGRRARTVGNQPIQPPERQLRRFAAARRTPELIWPGSMTPEVFVKEGVAPQSRLPLIKPMLRAVALPRGPVHGRLPGMGRGLVRRVGRAMRDTRMAQRATTIEWTGENLPGVVLAADHAVGAQLRSAAWNRGGTRAVSVSPKVSDLVPRFSTVSFEPQEAPFGYSIFKIQSGMPALPVSQAATPKAGQQQQRTAPKPSRQPKAEAIRLEDRFDAGLGNWVGGVSDWKVDVAGVRPGALALFAPSLAMSDYDLEFLARIDQKSLSWVFRASDEQNYHLATISISPQGRTFTRSSVIEDAPGLSVTTPVRQVGSPKAAITILTKVRGNDFTVSIDGETIERWSDNRLAIGGIGFLGAPDQRARLYWIRLVTGGSER
ncbi:MAG TPA: hypothetical protein VGE89_04925 [Bryobacteraceae bacterium]